MEDGVVPNETKCDLQNAVHKLFDEANFSARFDYRVILPVARLATKLLMCEKLIPFFSTAIHKEAKEIRTGLRTFHAYDAKDASRDLPVGRVKRQRIHEMLVELADLISFDTDRTAATWSTEPIEMVEHNRLFGDDTLRCVISCPEPIYQALAAEHKLEARMHTKMLNKNDWALLRTLQLEFAITMVHEVAHALFYALQGDQAYEPFFGDAAVSEVGFELEWRLFGGRITRLFHQDQTIRLYQKKTRTRVVGRSRLTGLVVMFEWPEQGMVEDYRGTNLRFDYKEEQIPKKDFVWRLPLDWFGSLFTKAFWASAEHDLTMLDPPREMAYTFKQVDGVPHPQSVDRTDYNSAAYYTPRAHHDGSIIRNGL